ncbi:hypothetical protein CC1G_07848 [Coprinopsis cinerea okayama7|uniref:Uncharacterized protein n=1 Tax=Coprinopsis cinerea (strain Okayama-7 / 130 / ATCC MYA-4618 / FGSC 9003) TaxID=240176 RepID=A8P418_COPC7|nr:hypothetical protein CC1G_07848 [Coprinopsis cinerea okayama7\|eukprot:XP_001838657.2 hypothetical protein CC1G_07848 [Coprinopsis cinerea okayama7\
MKQSSDHPTTPAPSAPLAVTPRLPLELVYEIQDRLFEYVTALHGQYCCPFGSAVNSSTIQPFSSPLHDHEGTGNRPLTKQDVYNFSLVARTFRSRSISHIFHKLIIRDPSDLVEVHQFMGSLVCTPIPPVNFPVSVIKSITIDFDIVIDGNPYQEESPVSSTLIQIYASSITECFVKWTSTDASQQDIDSDDRSYCVDWSTIPFTFQSLVESAVAKKGSLVSLSLHRINFPHGTLNRVWSPRLKYLDLRPEWPDDSVWSAVWAAVPDRWNDALWARELGLSAAGPVPLPATRRDPVDVLSRTIRFDTRVLKCDVSSWVLGHLEGWSALQFPNALRRSFQHLHTFDLVELDHDARTRMPSLDGELADRFRRWLVQLDAPQLTTIRLLCHGRCVWLWVVASCFRHIELVQRLAMDEADPFTLGQFMREGPVKASVYGLNMGNVEWVTVTFVNEGRREDGFVGATAVTVDNFLSAAEMVVDWEALSSVLHDRVAFPNWRSLTFDLSQVEGPRGGEILELERGIVGRLHPERDFSIRVKGR